MENAELQEQNAVHFDWICGKRPLFQSLFRQKKGSIILNFQFSILHCPNRCLSDFSAKTEAPAGARCSPYLG